MRMVGGLLLLAAWLGICPTLANSSPVPPSTASTPSVPTAAIPTSLPDAPAPHTPVATVRQSGLSRAPLGTNLFKITTPEMLWFVDQMKRAEGWLTQCEGVCGTAGADIWDTGEQDKLVLDEQGWVVSFGPAAARTFTHVAAVLYAGAPHLAPVGEWTVVYEGEGRIDYDYAPFVEVRTRAPGRDTLWITPGPDGLLRIRLSEINPHNHLRNIRVYPPGGVCGDDPFAYAATPDDCAPGGYRAFAGETSPTTASTAHTANTEPLPSRFHPLFLQELRLYRTLRFMQVQGIVEVLTPEPWHARSRLDAAIYPGGWGGIPPLELIFELANVVQAEPWVNLHHWADDDYVRNFAHLAREQLSPELSIYVEYANEVWNRALPFDIYGQEIEGWAAARWPQAIDEQATGEQGAPVDGFTLRMNYFGMRSAQICAIWKEVWGEEAARVRCVMGGAPWDIPTATALACPLYAAEAQIPHCAGQMDAVAIAPYFGTYISDLLVAQGGHFEYLVEWAQADAEGDAEDDAEDDEAGLDLLFHELRTGELLQAEFHEAGAVAAALQILDNNMQVAARYNLPVIAYEGGQHLSPVSSQGTGCVPWETVPECEPYRAIQELYIAANRDPRMGELYAELLAGWRTGGGTLFMHYHALGQPAYRFGAWGAKEYAGQPLAHAPKYEALADFAAANPCWWPGCGVGEIPPTLHRIYGPIHLRE